MFTKLNCNSQKLVTGKRQEIPQNQVDKAIEKVSGKYKELAVMSLALNCKKINSFFLKSAKSNKNLYFSCQFPSRLLNTLAKFI